MKNFDLATYGVAELNAQEMEEVSGGCLFAVIVGVVILAAAAIDYLQDGKLDGHINI